MQTKHSDGIQRVNASEASHDMAKPAEILEPGHYQRLRLKLTTRKRELQGSLTELNKECKQEYYALRDALGRRMDPDAFGQYTELKRDAGRKKAPFLREIAEIEKELTRIEPFFKREQRLENNAKLSKSRNENGKVDWDSHLRSILATVLGMQAAISRLEIRIEEAIAKKLV